MIATRFGGRLTILGGLLLLTHLGAATAAAQTADLVVTKTLVDPSDGLGVTPGVNIKYDIVVTNNGPDPATSVSVSDSTPSGLTWVANTGDCVSAFPCSLGTIGSGSSETITAEYTVSASYDPPTAIFNSATATASESDPSPLDATGSEIAEINGINCGNFAIAGGDLHTCAIVAGNGKAPPNDLDDDEMECWGDNFSGQSGPLTAGPWDWVTAGGDTTCGIQAGAITCFGTDGSGQVSNVPAGTDFIQVDSGFDHVCALHDSPDFSIECWGDDSFGQTSGVPASTDYVQVASGETNSCGVRTDGGIDCWGFDDIDFPMVSDVPTDTDFQQVALGAFHVCGLHTDGTVDCWGDAIDLFGIIAGIPVASFQFISSGAEHMCGLKFDGTVECWGGDDTFGEISGTPGDAFTAMDSGSFHNCGLLPDGTALCWGAAADLQTISPFRSRLCPVCGDGLIEAKETCEACANPDHCTPGTCTPSGTPFDPGSQTCDTDFPPCCSPITCTPTRLSEAKVCRAAGGSCDQTETCNGTSFSCPADTGPQPSGFICRGPTGGCDAPETCDGTATTCPSPGPVLIGGTTCRAVAGSCDVEETCDGTSDQCPADVVLVASTPCRTSAGVCDVEEVCDGSSGACPVDAFDSGTECRSSAGVCDEAEVCDGFAAACPTDFFKSGAVTCRPAASVCDGAEQCTGAGPDCPADVIATSTQVCRPAAGSCDVAETCDGFTTICPADLLQLPGTECRTATGVCDATETCTGTSASCPTDLFSASGILCRGAAGACDVAENCTGTSNSCPADAFASTATACNDGVFCNGADNCNGAGSCGIHSGNPCAGADGDADCVESCNEAGNNCLANDPNGSACDDGDACSSGEVCTAGSCGGGTVTECDDGDLCTFDTCDLDQGCVYLPAPEDTGCFEGGKGLLFIKNTQVPHDAKMKWIWKKGEAVAPSWLGAPDIDTDYSLCIFDQQGGESTLVGSYVVPAGSEGWKIKEGIQKFVNKDNPPDGVFLMKTKAKDAGKSSAILKGQGGSLDVPTPAASNLYVYHEPASVAQLRNSEGACWETEFVPLDFKKNSGELLKATFKK